MGLLTTDIYRLLQLFSEENGRGKSLCMMGKQDILCGWDSLTRMLKLYNVHYDPDLYAEIKGITPIDSVKFFQILGFSEVHVVDVSDYEGADIIFNLADDLPPELIQRFDYVLNGGTLEHIFNVAKALQNMSDMVKAGGRIIHIVPLYGYVNHGFYSFSPIAFLEYYEANFFIVKHIDMECILEEEGESLQKKWHAIFSQDCRLFTGEGINKYMRKIQEIPGMKMILLWCMAERTAKYPSNSFPMQGYYQALWNKETVTQIERYDGKDN